MSEAHTMKALREACSDNGGARAHKGGPSRRFTLCYSPFLDRVAHAPFSPCGASVLAALLTRALVRACAPTRKVLALDCDNTLWGGAVGELGAAGVELSAPWLAAQRFFLAAQRRGMLLVLVSRNHEEDVRAVFSQRRDELELREEHVVAIRANWSAKSANLRTLADQLCLSLGSFIFVDDSAAECAEVAQTICSAGAGCYGLGNESALGSSSLAIVHIPRDPSVLPAYLDHCWALDPPMERPTTRSSRPPKPDLNCHDIGGAGGTCEDASRTRLYRELAERKDFLAHAAGVTLAHNGSAHDGANVECTMSAAASSSAFLASLNLVVQILPLVEETADRAAQLTERTNQHNACRTVASATALLRLAQYSQVSAPDFVRGGPSVADRQPRASSPSDVKPLPNGGGYGKEGSSIVLTVRASDRFGDHGLIGLIVLDKEASVTPGAPIGNAMDERPTIALPRDTIHVRAWCLSCRSLHLGIEFAMLRHVAEIARAAGATKLAIHWVRAERNEPAAAFLFSVPGARFVTASSEVLGLPLGNKSRPVVDARNGWIPSNAYGPAPNTVKEQMATTAAAAAAATAAATRVLAEASQRPILKGTEHALGVAEALVPSPLGPSTSAVAAAASAAVSAAIDCVCQSGARLEKEAVPIGELLQMLARGERKKLTKWAALQVSRERRGSFARSADRAAAGLVIRGWIGGEVCRHHAAGSRCTTAGCPFMHPSEVGVQVRLQVGGTGEVLAKVSLGMSHDHDHRKVDRTADVSSAAMERLATNVAIATFGQSDDGPKMDKVTTTEEMEEADRDAELHDERTFGDVARYESSVRKRPPSGYVLLDVEVAAAIDARLREDIASPSAVSAMSSSVADVHEAPVGDGLAAPSHGMATRQAERLGPNLERRGWAKDGTFVMHHETYREIALRLSSNPSDVHEWVAAECERTKLVPPPYAEAWETVLKREAEIGDALAAAGTGAVDAAVAEGAGALSGASDDSPPAGASMTSSDAALAGEHARLRRQIRHAMHLMMQQSNPHTYYAGVKHICS